MTTTRVPGWVLAIPGLRQALYPLRLLRQRLAPRPNEHVAALLRGSEAAAAAGDPARGLELSRQALTADPAAIDAWLLAGRRAYEIAAGPDAGRRPLSHATPAAPANVHVPFAEDLDAVTLARASRVEDTAGASHAALAHRTEALAAENFVMAQHLEALRQQIGFRVDAYSSGLRYYHASSWLRTLALFATRHDLQSVPTTVQEIPQPLSELFTMQGEIELQHDCLSAAYPAGCIDVFSDLDVDTYRAIWRGDPPADDAERKRRESYFSLPHGEGDRVIAQALTATAPAAGDSIAILSPGGPIYEAMALEHGLRPITLRREAVDCTARGLEATTIDASLIAKRQFRLALSVDVVESAGLGLRGDRLDPDGDLALMMMFRQLIPPGGWLVLSLPMGRDAVIFNVGRVYGPVRLPLLLHGWRVHQHLRHVDPWLHGLDEHHAALVLERETT